MRAVVLAACTLAVGCGDDAPGGAEPQQQVTDCATGAICRGPAPSFSDLDHDGPYASATFLLAPTADSAGATVYYPTDASPPLAYAPSRASSTRRVAACSAGRWAAARC